MKGESLQQGMIIKTVSGKQLKVLEMLGSGGQGNVYKIEIEGEQKALKWFKNLGRDPVAFYENIENNILKGPPDDSFLWMQDLTEWNDGSFGYVMDVIPSGYYELTKYLLKRVKYKDRDGKSRDGFRSWKVVVDAALKIVKGFRLLHNRGQSYQDLNDGNFFINPESGDVLIGDNDNVAPNGDNLGILGKPRYMAPEVVRGNNLPDTASDRYSLSVILFLLLCHGHPLEGERLPYVMTPEWSKKIYGTQPIFIFDPENGLNRPNIGSHKPVIDLWTCLPSYLKELFIRAFSGESTIKKRRVTEFEWLKALTRFRSDIVRCPCNNEIFTENSVSITCEKCGSRIQLPNIIQFDDYTVTA